MLWIKTEATEAGGHDHVSVAPHHMPARADGSVWTAAPRSRKPYAVRFVGLAWEVGEAGGLTFRTLSDALQWVAQR